MSNIAYVKLQNICMQIVDCEHKTAPIQDVGIPSIRTTDIKNGRILIEQAKRVSEETYKIWTKRLEPRENDIILAREAPIGEVGIVPPNQKLCLGQRTVLIRPNPKVVEPRFLLYYLVSPWGKTELTTKGTGSTVDHLNVKDIRNLRLLPLPPLPIQRRIADILSAYDELIEVNQQRIRLLEDTARQLYREWFVRLRFPGWKETRMVKGGPEGWAVKELRSFGKIFTGKTPSTTIKEYYGGDIPFIKTPDMHNGIFVFDTQEKLTEKGNSTQLRSSLPENSICVSCIGTGGIVAITTAKKSQTNQQINSLILRNIGDLEFLYFRISDLKETIELFGYTGATMTNLSKGKFEKLKILYPKANYVEKYHLLTNPIFEQIKTLQRQNAHLRQIRDRLLPRLVSGKLAVG